MKDPVFYGREAELKTLLSAYESPKAEIVLIYGDRRMGKTALIQKFCEGKPTFFYTAKPWKAARNDPVESTATLGRDHQCSLSTTASGRTCTQWSHAR